MAVNALWFFLAVIWVGLKCVIVFFPEHTHFFKELIKRMKLKTMASTKKTLKLTITISQNKAIEYIL